MKIGKKIRSMVIGLLFLNTLLFADLDTATTTLANTISKKLVGKEKKKIAVIDFNNGDNSVSQLGHLIAEKLTKKLFDLAKDKYTLVDRSEIDKLLKELNLSSTGLLEAKAREKMGKMYGVDVIVTGTLTDLGNDIEIQSKAITVEHSDYLAMGSAKIPKTDKIKNLFTKVIDVSSKNTVKGKRNKLLFKNSYIRIKIEKIDQTDDDEVTMKVSFENRTDTRFVIKLKKNENRILNKKNSVLNNKNNELFGSDNWIYLDGNQKKVSQMVFISDTPVEWGKFNIDLTFYLTKIADRKKPISCKIDISDVKIP